MPTKKSVGGKLAWEFGREHFIRERDEISGGMCYTVYGRCEQSFKLHVKDALSSAKHDVNKTVGNFQDYVALRQAILACLPGVPEQMVTSTLRFAANNFHSAADAVGDRMSGLCKQATTTIDSLAKHLLSSLLQLPVAEIDDGDFARDLCPAPTC